MALTTTTSSTTITVTAADEDLTFAKIQSEINGLSDTNNTCTSKTFVLNKKLVLVGNQALNLGNNITYQFTGTSRYLSISSNFTSVSSGVVVEGKRVGIIHLAHFNNNTAIQQVIINNSVETHLVLIITQNNSNYPRMYINNTHADSTLRMKMSSIDATNPQIYFKGGWVGSSYVVVENCSYTPVNNNWFDIVEANAVEPFKTYPEVAYPTAGYNSAAKRGQFGNIAADSKLNSLVSDIGIGTSDYIYHPAFSDRKIIFRYNFKFNFSGAPLDGGKLGFVSGGTIYQEEDIVNSVFDINNVELLKGDTRNGAGGAGGYSPLTFEEFNRKTGTVIIRKPGVVSQSLNYSKIAGVKSFSYSNSFLVDEHYGTTATDLTLISTADELYDLARQKVATYLTLPDDVITVTNTALVIKAGWVLKSVNGGTGPVLSVSNSTKTITAKLGENGLQKTAKFDSLSGTIDTSLDGNTDMHYIKANGKVPVAITISSEAGTNNPVFGVWLKSQGVTNRAGILTAPGNGIIDVNPNDVMYFVSDAVNAYRSEPVEFTVGAFGQVLTSSIRRIKKVDGTNLLPDALLVAQQRIADMMNYNQAAARVDITLPSNYATDERWDSTSNTWTFKTEDFWALAYKAEQLQSSEGSLIDPSVVIIDNYELSLTSYSSLTFRQDVNNINCTINMNAFIIKRQGDTEQANTFVDHSNGVILVNAGSLIIADVTAPPSILSGVTNDLKIVNNNIKDILKLDPTGSGFQDIP